MTDVRKVCAGMLRFGFNPDAVDLGLWFEACERRRIRGANFSETLGIYRTMGGRVRGDLGVTTANLTVDELDTFYTGDQLLYYCTSCSWGDYAPSGKVGCLKGDDPDVREFLDRFQVDDLLTPDERCPGFTAKEAINTDVTLLEHVGAMLAQGGEANGAFFKEVPLEPVGELEELDDDDRKSLRLAAQVDAGSYLALLEQATRELLAQSDAEDAGVLREIIEGSLRGLQEHINSATEVSVGDYSNLEEQL